MNTCKCSALRTRNQKQNFALIALSLLAAPLAFAQIAAPAAASAPAASSGSAEEEIIELSPFNVDTTKDSGYYAENTLAGSRMNSNLSDIAASISVVTKQQMEDTASLDINDVFRYEVGTEGSATYTPQVIDRGTYKDTIAGYTLGNDGGTTTNAQSNRVRGLSSPEASLNYFQTNSRIPLDAYNTQSIEISRGPNSMLFGLGSPAGIVNQTATQASVNKDSGQVQFRTDQYGSIRESIGYNKVLIKGKLGVYGAMLYNKQQFERKPSYDTTKRMYASITYKPFKKTTIRAFGESYSNHASRPNSITPRDYVSNWFASGRPAYDPVTRKVTILDTGAVVGPYATVTTSPYAVTGINPSTKKSVLINDYTSMSSKNAAGTAYYVSGIAADNLGRALVRIDGDNQVDTFARQPQYYPTAQTYPVTTTPTGTSLGWTSSDSRWATMDQGWTSSIGALLPTTASTTSDYYGTYYYSGVTDKKIYDWTKYNVNQGNFSRLRSGTYNVEVEQEIIPNLFLNAAFLRQDIDSWENNTISQLTGATLAIDTNTRLPDGSINPYFGLPFIAEGNGPDTFFQPQTDDNARAMLAYNLDFTHKGGWMKYLGNHKLLAMWSGLKTNASVERWRNGWVSGDADGTLRYCVNTANPASTIWSGSGLSRYYYMASPGDAQGVVTHSTGDYGNQGWESLNENSIRVFDYNNNAWKNVTVNNGLMFADNGSYRRQRKLTSSNFAAQSNFWEDRIVTTLGTRTDHLSLRRTQIGQYLDENGNTVAAYTNAQLYQNGVVNYDLVMNGRWTPWENIQDHSQTKGIVFRPLKGWKFTSGDSFLADALNGLSFHYNESNNFNPPANSQTDFFKKYLPKPEGEGKDYGIGFAILKNKLVGRVTWFNTTQYNDRASTAATLLTRLMYQDTTLMYNWAAAIVRIRNGANPATETKWNDNTVHSVDDAASQAAITKLMGIPYNYYSGINVAGTQTNEAKGVEAQLTYNPTPNWTIKFTGSKQETTYSDIAPEYDAWLNQRMTTWKAATSEIADFTDVNGASYSLKNFWTSYGYSTAAKITNTDGNTSAGNYFNNSIASQEATARALEGAVSPLQSKWRGSVVTNYNFTTGALRGWGIGAAERYQSAVALGYYGKKADATNPYLIGAVDVTRPIYGDADWFTDLWVSYSTKICGGKYGLKVQLNVANVTEDGGLKPVAVNWDGKPWSYRIVDSRQFMLTTTLSF